VAQFIKRQAPFEKWRLRRIVGEAREAAIVVIGNPRIKSETRSLNRKGEGQGGTP
jgi:hypothetical protein